MKINSTSLFTASFAFLLFSGLSQAQITVTAFDEESDLVVTGGSVFSAANFGSTTAGSPLVINGISHTGFVDGSKNVVTAVGDGDVLLTIGGSIGDFRGTSILTGIGYSNPSTLFSLFKGIAASGPVGNSSGGTVGLDIGGLTIGTEYLYQVYWEHTDFTAEVLDISIEGVITTAEVGTVGNIISYQFTATDTELNSLFDFANSSTQNNWISGYSLQVVPVPEASTVALLSICGLLFYASRRR